MISRLVATFAVAVAAGASTAAPAAAIRPCDTGDVQCYQTCYVPEIDKYGVHWVYC